MSSMPLMSSISAVMAMLLEVIIMLACAVADAPIDMSISSASVADVSASSTLSVAVSSKVECSAVMALVSSAS